MDNWYEDRRRLRSHNAGSRRNSDLFAQAEPDNSPEGHDFRPQAQNLASPNPERDQSFSSTSRERPFEARAPEPCTGRAPPENLQVGYRDRNAPSFRSRQGWQRIPY